jgi:inward rectifier potassium channel
MESSDQRFSRIKKIGAQTGLFQDFYHTLLTSSWSKFFTSYLLFFLTFNIFFATAYWCFPDALSGTDQSFWHSFVFSVHTFSTVGYGVFAPHSNWSHVVVIIESIFSVFVTALLTGLIFSKFSRPSAKIIFTDHILINNFEGKRTLMFRMGNLRTNQIAEAQVKLVALKSIKTVEGENIRRQIDMSLVRSTSLFFALTWSIMHVIDESSPLYNLTQKDIIDQNVEIGVSVVGYDSSFSQTIHANCIYSTQDFLFDRYFEDVFDIQGNQILAINYKNFNNIK